MQQDLPAVRIAKPSDEDAIMAMCQRLHDENGLFSFSAPKVRKLVRRCFAGDKVIVAVIGKEGETLEASICLEMAEFYYTTDWHLGELWNYVAPEFRKSRNAAALIEFGKGCARRMKLPFFTGIITNKQMAGKVRLYQQLLGRATGAFFIDNANWKSEPIEDFTELRHRLQQYADRCSTKPRDITSSVMQKQIAPVLREAARALAEESLFGQKPNGAAAPGGV